MMTTEPAQRPPGPKQPLHLPPLPRARPLPSPDHCPFPVPDPYQPAQVERHGYDRSKLEMVTHDYSATPLPPEPVTQPPRTLVGIPFEGR